jgi:hypothetical protein
LHPVMNGNSREHLRLDIASACEAASRARLRPA